MKMVAKYTFHDGIWIKVFNFWFNFIEKINFSLFVSVFNRDHKADVADVTYFFNRADWPPARRAYASERSPAFLVHKRRTFLGKRWNS